MSTERANKSSKKTEKKTFSETLYFICFIYNRRKKLFLKKMVFQYYRESAHHEGIRAEYEKIACKFFLRNFSDPFLMHNKVISKLWIFRLISKFTFHGYEALVYWLFFFFILNEKSNEKFYFLFARGGTMGSSIFIHNFVKTAENVRKFEGKRKFEYSLEFCRRDAAVTMEGQFLVRQIYDDEITYNIIGAAVKRLSKFNFSWEKNINFWKEL